MLKNDLQAIYLDVVDDPSAHFQTLMRIGKTAPLHSTSSGKLILSSLPEHQLREYLAPQSFEKLTLYIIASKEALIEELDRVRAQGYATDNQESEMGIQCAAVAVYNYTDHLAACLSCFSTPERFTPEQFSSIILPELLATANAISARMGYDAQAPSLS